MGSNPAAYHTEREIIQTMLIGYSDAINNVKVVVQNGKLVSEDARINSMGIAPLMGVFDWQDGASYVVNGKYNPIARTAWLRTIEALTED